jgi:hypothetical protein
VPVAGRRGHGLRIAVQAGHAVLCRWATAADSARWPICFSNFPNKFKAAANFHILYRFEFKLKNCEANFNR